jgi:hypothetical protein
MRGKEGAMTSAVVAGAVVVAVLNAIPGLLGGWLWYQGEPTAIERPGAEPAGGEVGGTVGGTPRTTRRLDAFWVLLRVGQGSALAFALAVGSLAAASRYSSDRLFYLYALLSLAIGFVAEQLRVASAQTILDQRELSDAQAVGELPEREQRGVVAEIVRREMGVMAISALVVVFLALRAAGTAHGF